MIYYHQFFSWKANLFNTYNFTNFTLAFINTTKEFLCYSSKAK